MTRDTFKIKMCTIKEKNEMKKIYIIFFLKNGANQFLLFFGVKLKYLFAFLNVAILLTYFYEFLPVSKVCFV